MKQHSDTDYFERTPQKRIVSISLEGPSATLSAKGNGSRVTIECNETGTAIKTEEKGASSTSSISKVTLSSVRHFSLKNDQAASSAGIFLIAGCFLLGIGYSETLSGIFIIVSLGLFIYYILSQITILEFESAGGKTTSVVFSGSAAGRTEELEAFCKAATRIDGSISPSTDSPTL